MRELDWHTKFTNQSILKSRFYLDPSTPFIEKFIGIIILLILAFILIKFIKELYLSRIYLYPLNVPFMFLFLSISLFLTGKFLDGVFRHIPMLIVYREDYGDSIRLVEEILESIAAFVFILFPPLHSKHHQKQMAVPRLNPTPAHHD